MRVFVYGTLKHGGPNNYLLSGQVFVGEYRTPPKYAMYNLGLYPAMLLENEGVSIKGEIWQVSASVIQRLDFLENVPNLYYRARIPCGKYGTCETYLMRPELLKKLQSAPSTQTVKLLKEGVWNNG